jgi:hypothetical protein
MLRRSSTDGASPRVATICRSVDRVAALLGALFVAVSLMLAVRAGPGPTRMPARHEQPDGDLRERFLQVAREYRTYGRVDATARWAPAMCVQPSPGRLRQSASSDASTHGRKLYYLYARDRAAYLAVTLGPATPKMPVGQVIVKEAWWPQAGVPAGAGGHAMAPAQPGTFTGVFIMLKTARGTPGTDAGWLYGTVGADGRTVTSAGRVRSCVGCHSRAPYDGVFGLPRD